MKFIAFMRDDYAMFANASRLTKEDEVECILIVVRGKEEMGRVFEECHKAQFGGHVGRDNTLTKIKKRYFWPGFYNDTMKMISFFLLM